VPIGDAEALSQAMLQVADRTESDRKQYSEQVSQLASPDIVGRQLEAIFNEIVKS
jgi:hypothetical protein